MGWQCQVSVLIAFFQYVMCWMTCVAIQFRFLIASNIYILLNLTLYVHWAITFLLYRPYQGPRKSCGEGRGYFHGFLGVIFICVLLTCFLHCLYNIAPSFHWLWASLHCACALLTIFFLCPPYNFEPSLQLLHFPYIEPNEDNFKLMWNCPELTNG